jgi:hypothetical protein
VGFQSARRHQNCHRLNKDLQGVMKHSSTKHYWRAVYGLLTMLLMSGVTLQAYASGTSLPSIQSALPPSHVVIEPTIEPTIEPDI